MRTSQEVIRFHFAVASIANGRLVSEHRGSELKPKATQVLPALRHVPASDEAPPIYTPASAKNRLPRRYKFRREHPATQSCLLALSANARQSPKEKARAREPTTANRAAVN